jgi:hypothetical protein
MQHCLRIVKHVSATWRISGDVCHISTVLFCRYANHICASHTVKTNYWDECDLPPTICTSYIFGESFILARTYMAVMWHAIIHSYCIRKLMLKKLKVTLKKSISIRSHILRILPISTIHGSFVQYQNSEFSRSLGII